ncbi:glycosyl transferase family 1 [Lactiplantibacillus plantarum]|uniref:glycosyl transferase family 1 n=2 Tax=Lactiplantibacillus plantarum TaxID=1590 RepID=UPI000E09073B|nr:glycosyl transferase family 1 [Lactiplantibacillus plantarum]MCG0556352.1 glycosyl transferase family 1 [Lactiplantibacillus plantarum]MCG0816230.1 glycosyl transferase family 1 [Lactiplantibacillus plantarum]MCG0819298.1 glycosyl transferase family 1 [Lactiplantibacillus plantarum]MCG0822558.1 glycosyl transferase family 1 [Lactiplantibacillus plantarum]MCG0841267.1 glycosyl transferase family 1 [Lactiplantibacillus plantarum]
MQKSVIQKLKQALIDTGNLKSHENDMVVLAVSVSDRRHRANVKFYRDKSFNTLWTTVANDLNTAPKNSWVRIDLVQAVQKLRRSIFETKLAKVPKMNYWRYGVSFDADFKHALLEMEINGQNFFKPDKDFVVGEPPAKSWADYHQIENYLRERESDPTIDISGVQNVWIFTTAAVFSDGQKIRPLAVDGFLTSGIRTITNKRKEIKKVIEDGEAYLINQLDKDGKFIYGYFPARQRVLSSYNILRHFSTIYALLEASQFSQHSESYRKAKLAIQWGIDASLVVIDNAAYVNDHGELKLGAQAMLILAICKYQEVTHDQTFLPTLKQLFKGVRSFWNSSTGFVHVLDVNLESKGKFRTIYYDGEIVFALTRMYELDPSIQIEATISEMLDYMVKLDYGQYHDHWLAYAVNGALDLFPEARAYMALGAKNIFTHLNYIQKRKHASPTLLELIDASQKMVYKVKKSGNDDLLAPYDVLKLSQLADQRASYEIQTGAWYAEIAMYLYHPQKFIGGFYARDDSFRTRIDDCEHFLSGLVNYYNYTYRQA